MHIGSKILFCQLSIGNRITQYVTQKVQDIFIVNSGRAGYNITMSVCYYLTLKIVCIDYVTCRSHLSALLSSTTFISHVYTDVNAYLIK